MLTLAGREEGRGGGQVKADTTNKNYLKEKIFIFIN